VHPIDRLHLLRQQAADIRREIAGIRELLINGDISRHGDRYTASVQSHVVLTAVQPDTIDWQWVPGMQDPQDE
jgi:regulator of extracellular matrix RemA (YlzA/DUF370 family)